MQNKYEEVEIIEEVKDSYFTNFLQALAILIIINATIGLAIFMTTTTFEADSPLTWTLAILLIFDIFFYSAIDAYESDIKEIKTKSKIIKMRKLKNAK